MAPRLPQKPQKPYVTIRKQPIAKMQTTPVHICLDSQVLRWFKAKGPGYQTRINAVLLAFVKPRERAEAMERGPQ